MLDNTVSRRVALEAYGFQTWPDQITFMPPDGPVGSLTAWYGLCTPSLTVWASWDNDAAFVVGLRTIFLPGLSATGLVLDFDIASMRLVDPVTMTAGPLSASQFYGSGSTTIMTVDWGDGTTPQTFALDPAVLGTPPQHTYAAAGTYTVTASTSFNDSNYTFIGGTPSVAASVTVS